MKKFNQNQIISRRGHNVPADVHKLVVKMAARCMRELSKKDYELPELTRSIEVATKKSGQASYGGRHGICIDVGDFIRGSKFVWEYAAIREDAVIGRVRDAGSAENMLFALVAHEVAHHVQRAYAMRMAYECGKPEWEAMMRKPHGKGWQMIYRWLRRELVNPAIAAALKEAA
jgi:hypothetical protein